MYLLPNVILLSGYMYGIHQNCYGIVSPKDKKIVMIDCGLDQSDLTIIYKNIKLWNLESYNISDIFLTHCHFDHAGNAHYFELHGSTIHIGDKDADSILYGDEHTLSYAYGRSFPVCSNVDRISDEQRFPIDDDNALIAYSTPGHSAGSICYELLNSDYSVLFCGDFFHAGVNAGEIRIGVKVDSNYSYDDCVKSAERIKGIPVDFVLAGHYQPDFNKESNLTGLAYRELLVNRNLYR